VSSYGFYFDLPKPKSIFLLEVGASGFLFSILSEGQCIVAGRGEERWGRK